MSQQNPHRDADPALGALIETAYAERVEMEVAARHLWMIHRAAGTVRSQGRRTRKALVSVLAGGMLFMSSGGAVAASADALPGDMLWSVKRGVEVARMVLTVTPEGDARLHLALAKRRMAEARTAETRRPEVVPELVREAQQSLETAERKGGTKVAQEVEETSQELTVLVAVLDESADDRVASRKTTSAETEMAMMSSATPTPSEAESTEASASPTPSEAESTEASASPSPGGTSSASPTPSQTATTTPSPSSSPETTASPTPTPTASESTTPSATPTPTATTSPSSEPAPTSSPGRKYESVDPTPTPTGTQTATPSPTPQETPTG